MTTSLTLQSNMTELTATGSLWVGVGLMVFGLAMLFVIFGLPWVMSLGLGTAGEPEHNGADEFYAAELHAQADAEPDPDGWSAVNGFDYLTVFERIADGYGAAVSPPAVLFDTLAAQLPAPDPTWLTFDTSAWKTVRAASDELAREYPTPGVVYAGTTLSEEQFDDFRERWREAHARGPVFDLERVT